MTNTATATDCMQGNIAVGGPAKTTAAAVAIGAAFGSLIVVLVAVMTTPWLLFLEPLAVAAALHLATPGTSGTSGFARIVMESWFVRWLTASLGLIGGVDGVLWLAVVASFGVCGAWAGWRLSHADARAARKLARPARAAREPITLSSVVGVSFGEHHLRTRRHVRRARMSPGESSPSLVDSAA